MATRFYLPSTGAAAGSPAYAAWDDTAQAAARLKCVTTRISSAMTAISFTDSLALTGLRTLWRQYVSDPIGAQTISGTVKARLRVAEGNTDINYDQVCLCVKVVSNDCTTLRGTLLSLGQHGSTNEFSVDPTFTNRIVAGSVTVGNVTSQDNDRIVIEVGARPSVLPLDIEIAISAIFGDNSGTDLPEDETTTAANNPWLEFSANLQPPAQTLTPSAVNGVSAALAGALVVGALAINGIGAASDPSSGKHSVAAVAGIGFVETPGAFIVPDSYNPVAATSMAEGVDVFVGRASGNLGDLNDSTGTTANAPASWPTGTGTLLLGTQTQVLRDFPSALVISHVVFCARGVLSQDSGYLSNLRVEASGIGGSYHLVVESWPDIRPYVGPSGPYDLARTAKSSLQTLAPDGQPWTWLKLDAGIVTLDCKVDHANITTVGHFAGGYVSEIWFEVYGPQGSKSDPVIIKSRAGSPVRKTFTEVAALVMVLFGQSQVPT